MSRSCSSLDYSHSPHMTLTCSSPGCSLSWSNKSYSDTGWVETRNLMTSNMRDAPSQHNTLPEPHPGDPQLEEQPPQPPPWAGPPTRPSMKPATPWILLLMTPLMAAPMFLPELYAPFPPPHLLHEP